MKIQMPTLLTLCILSTMAVAEAKFVRNLWDMDPQLIRGYEEGPWDVTPTTAMRTKAPHG